MRNKGAKFIHRNVLLISVSQKKQKSHECQTALGLGQVTPQEPHCTWKRSHDEPGSYTQPILTMLRTLPVADSWPEPPRTLPVCRGSVD